MPLKWDFYPHEWTGFYDKCGFTELELDIIELKRRHGRNWTNYRYAKELGISLRTFERRLEDISRKIIYFL